MYINPYAAIVEKTCFKVNFHAHSDPGDGGTGLHPTAEVKAFYKELGFGALCISNLDLYTDTRGLSDELHFIQGVEYGQGSHMLTVGVTESLHSHSHQEAIDRTNRAGGFVVLCHPNWMHKEYWPWAEIDRLTGYLGLEVINMLISRFSGSALATDTWDHILSRGKLAWGFGSDDFVRFCDAGRSYNGVFAATCDDSGIQEAVQSGRFVATTGLVLESLTLEGNRVRVKARHPVDTYDNELIYTFIGDGGEVKAEVKGEAANWTLTDEHYLRIEVRSPNGMKLFTQPIYDSSVFARP